jgi:hypothetical protein
VNDRNVSDGDDQAESQEVVSQGTDMDAEPLPGRASPFLEARKMTEGGLKQRGDACPVHDTLQTPSPLCVSWHNVSVQCSEGRASHTVVPIRAPEDRAASTLHGGRVGGQDGGTQAVAKAPLELPTLELPHPRELESIQPVGGGAACAAKEAGASPFAFLIGHFKRGQQGSGANL